MPARWFCIIILGFWLFSTGWMFKRDWLPWLLATDEAPPFVFELADEVVTQHAIWTLYRNGAKMGSARTSLRLVEDNTFEWVHTLKDLEYSASLAGLFELKAVLPIVTTTMYVTPKGELLRFNTTGELKLHLPPLIFKAGMSLQGELSGGQVSGECTLKSELGELKQAYGPTPVKGTNVFSPLQPLFRIRGLHLGKSWKMNQVNPLDDALWSAIDQISKKFSLAIPKPPNEQTELLAEVLPEYQEFQRKDVMKKCFVIEYRSDKVIARTWVDAQDGTVLRQEASLGAESLVLERD